MLSNVVVLLEKTTKDSLIYAIRKRSYLALEDRLGIVCLYRHVYRY
jgi:hypothetical protein